MRVPELLMGWRVVRRRGAVLACWFVAVGERRLGCARRRRGARANLL